MLRDLQPTEKLLFLSKLAQQLAEQLYGEGCNCQLPVETSRPLSVAMFFNCQLPAKNTHTYIIYVYIYICTHTYILLRRLCCQAAGPCSVYNYRVPSELSSFIVARWPLCAGETQGLRGCLKREGRMRRSLRLTSGKSSMTELVPRPSAQSIYKSSMANVLNFFIHGCSLAFKLKCGCNAILLLSTYHDE